MTADVTGASDNWAIAVRVRWFFRASELCRLVETIRFKVGERSSHATIFLRFDPLPHPPPGSSSRHIVSFASPS